MPLLLLPILVIVYAFCVYHWHLNIGHIHIRTPWFIYQEFTSLVLLYGVIFATGLIYIGMILSWILRIPRSWRTWRIQSLLHKTFILHLFELHPQALKKANQGLRLNPHHPLLLYLKGRILCSLGQKTDAIQTFGMIKKYPLLSHYGLICLLKNDLNERHRILKLAFKALPKSPWLHTLLGQQKDYVKNPSDLIDFTYYDHTAKADIYALKGRLTQNPKWFKKAWYCNPCNIEIFQDYFKSATSEKQALYIAQKAYYLNPHPQIMQEILRLKNITDPLEQYAYIQKQNKSSSAMVFYLGYLKRQYVGRIQT